MYIFSTEKTGVLCLLRSKSHWFLVHPRFSEKPLFLVGSDGSANPPNGEPPINRWSILVVVVVGVAEIGFSHWNPWNYIYPLSPHDISPLLLSLRPQISRLQLMPCEANSVAVELERAGMAGEPESCGVVWTYLETTQSIHWWIMIYNIYIYNIYTYLCFFPKQAMS